MSARRAFLSCAILALLAATIATALWTHGAWAFAVVGPVLGLGVSDLLQTRQAVRRNFPVIGRARYLLEAIRPEINQYFVESNTSGTPFSREARSVVYQRAKDVIDTLPFGTERNVYETGYEWINHSICARHPSGQSPRVSIGGTGCERPYRASVLNVSAMSFGALSHAAVSALNRGAKMGAFAHNTGEGGISPYHLAGGDLVWQLGTAYFGARDPDGRFSDQQFAKRAALDAVTMIEIKLSQGAKPGHGGILPAAKLTPEIADIRGVPLGRDVLSPPAHTAFDTPIELLEFVARLRRLSGGKPVGFKLCVGKRSEFLAICKAMLETGILPDFITVDGAEGGTGAAPLEFSNVVGTPLVEGLVFVHNSLLGIGVREHIRVLASGRIVTGFDIAHKLAIGADAVYSARAMMFALGCIQARRCNTNACPTGVATQDPELVRGLVVSDKATRVANYHRNTVKAFCEILAAAGLDDPRDLRPWHVVRRVSPTETRTYADIFDYLHEGQLLGGQVPETYRRAWMAARPDSFSDTPPAATARAALG